MNSEELSLCYYAQFIDAPAVPHLFDLLDRRYVLIWNYEMKELGL